MDENHFKFGLSDCDVWCIVLVYGETKAERYELTTLIKVLTDEKER